MVKVSGILFRVDQFDVKLENKAWSKKKKDDSNIKMTDILFIDECLHSELKEKGHYVCHFFLFICCSAIDLVWNLPFISAFSVLVFLHFTSQLDLVSSMYDR